MTARARFDLTMDAEEKDDQWRVCAYSCAQGRADRGQDFL